MARWAKASQANTHAITFGVLCRGDLKSCKIEDQLKIKFADMGKLQVALHAEVIFPNIELSKSALPYGHVLDTVTAHRYVIMKNSSKAAVSYKWYIQPAGAFFCQAVLAWLNVHLQMNDRPCCIIAMS